jgi:hypothetical protein
MKTNKFNFEMFKNGKAAQTKLGNPVKFGCLTGDKMLITGPTTGALYVTVDEIHDDVQAVQTAQQGTRVSIKVPEKVRPSDKLFKIISVETAQN